MVKKNWQTEYEIMKIVANSKVLLEVLVWKYVMLSMAHSKPSNSI